MEFGPARVRRVTATKLDKITAIWDLDDNQMGEFRDWFDTEIAGGLHWFSMELYVGDSGAKIYDARFSGMYNAELLPGLTWQITATFEIRNG